MFWHKFFHLCIFFFKSKKITQTEECVNQEEEKMYKGVPKRFWAIVATLLLGYMLIACGDSADSSTTNKTETDSEVAETVGSQSISDGTSEESADATDCPEGYVYDYQVSMEPIPEEIAALGGPCQGTIHAYPSRIAMALTELQMEENPVLKAEVEKRIPEIEAALEEEIGGDFVVDGVILRDDLTWVFICTEVATGYQFDLYYANQEYYAKIYGSYSGTNAVRVTDYYNRGKESIVLKEELLPIIMQTYEQGGYMVSSQLYANVINITVVEYTEEVDRCLEQEKLLNLWDDLRAYDENIYYDINLVFYPYEYQSVINEKLSSAVRYDYSATSIEEVARCLVNSGDVVACFNYSDIEYMEGSNLDNLLEQYQENNYDDTVVWDYWVE